MRIDVAVSILADALREADDENGLLDALFGCQRALREFRFSAERFFEIKAEVDAMPDIERCDQLMDELLWIRECFRGAVIQERVDNTICKLNEYLTALDDESEAIRAPGGKCRTSPKWWLNVTTIRSRCAAHRATSWSVARSSPTSRVLTTSSPKSRKSDVVSTRRFWSSSSLRLMGLLVGKRLRRPPKLGRILAPLASVRSKALDSPP